MAFLIFSILLVYIIRDKPWKKIAIVLSGITLIYILNVVRITSMLVIGYNFGADLGLQLFHLLGGWVLIFLGTVLLLIMSEKLFKTKIFGDNQPKCIDCTTQTKTNQNVCFKCGRILKPKDTTVQKNDLLKVAITIAIVAMLLSIQVPVFALTQTPANTIINTPTGTQTGSIEIFPIPSNYTLQFLYRDTAFEELAQQDMALEYLYYPDNASLKPIYVSLEIASTRAPLHRWETCLISFPLSRGWSPKATQIELTDYELYENPPITGRYFLFQDVKLNLTQAVLYWFETATFNINSTSQQKNVKISLISFPETEEEIASLREQQLAIGKAIVAYWEPTKLWSTAALFLSTNGAYLAAVSSVLLGATAIFYIIKTIEQRKANRKAYDKLSQSNKEIIDATQTADKKTRPTLSMIVAAYQKATGKTIDDGPLLSKLITLKRERIIESQITNRRDEPIETWKA